MRRHSARLGPQLTILALSMSLLGCGPTLPPAQNPEAPTPPQSETRPLRDSDQASIPKAFTSGGPVTPIDMRSDAPPPDAQPNGNVLTQPGQPSVSLDDLQGGLPTKIPQGMAGALLQPLDQGPIGGPLAPGIGPGLPDGCAYGALPDLVNYGVYANLLYYPFRSCWVPYILVDDFYYPYVYQPFFDPLFIGYCYYPLFIFRHGYYYPYYFHSPIYYYGYLDWEYNWPHYRERHDDYDWSEIGRKHRRRYNDDDFEQWRDGKIRRRERSDWQREEPPRKGGPRVDRDGPQDRGGGAPPRDGKAGERRDRKEGRPDQVARGGDGPSGDGKARGRQEGKPRREQIAEDGERTQPKSRREQVAEGGERTQSKSRREQVAEGGERTHSKSRKERAEGGGSQRQQKEGRQGKGGRRLQSEEEDEQEQLD